MSRLVNAARKARNRGRAKATATRHAARDRVRRGGWRRLAIDSGIVDRTWIGLQLGREFETDDQAVDAYFADWRSCSPHPLFEPAWLATSGGAEWEPLSLNPLIWYLANRQVRRERSPHPLFDLATFRAAHDGADAGPEHPHGPLARWLATSTGATELPTPDGFGAITFDAFRDAAYSAAKEHAAADLLLRAPRRTTHLPVVSRTAATTGAAGTATDGPAVTVLLATRDRAPELRRAIGTLQSQTTGDWELVVVDDGSTDDTPSVVSGIAAFDARVTYHRVQRSGRSRALNDGIARARGRYLAFLDPDVAWTPGFLASMVGELETNGWSLAHAAVRIRTRAGDDEYAAFEGTREHLLQRNHIELGVLVARADAVRSVGGFDETLHGSADQDLVLTLAERHGLHLVPVVGAEQHDAGSQSRPDHWRSVVLQKHLVDWAALATRERTAGLTSVVLPVRGGPVRTIDWIRSGAGTPGIELVLVGVQVDRGIHSIAATAAAATGGRVSWSQVSSDLNDAAAQNLGFAASHGDRVVFVLNQVAPDVTTLSSLADALDDPSVAVAQPVLVDHAGLIISAGAVFGHGGVRPRPFLQGHHQRDLRVGNALEVPAVLSPVIAARAADVIALQGLDPVIGTELAEVDLSMRAHPHGRSVVRPICVVRSTRDDLLPRLAYIDAVDLLERRWDRAPAGTGDALARTGFEIVLQRNEVLSRAREISGPPAPLDNPLLVPTPVVRPRVKVSERPKRLRWTIDTAAPAGPRGETWGDTHFARSLATALEQRGQHVAVDNRALRQRGSRDLDDVLLVLRGLDLVVPRPGPLCLQWIISHPDLVTPEEVAPYDAVFAASLQWSAEKTAAWGIPIEPLLQCTDTALFSPDRIDDEARHEVLFVGNSRGVYRNALRSAMAAGADVTLFGGDWARVLPNAKVTASHVPNDELGRLYSSAGVVLNDHWEDMRRDGFVSNRLFDAAASGARVISDDVAGVAEIFGDQVQVFRSDADMRDLLERSEKAFPAQEELVANAMRIREEHSFDRRAQQLLETALRLRP
jgi:GT2 family glycosyltransferase